MMETPPAGPLKDGYGRRIDYLRVSVTDRCDLRCSYCLPKDFKGFETPSNWLDHEEILRLVGLFVALGVSKVRLTGGEPLLRRGIAGLAGAIAAMPGLADLSVSTNGTQLAPVRYGFVTGSSTVDSDGPAPRSMPAACRAMAEKATRASRKPTATSQP